MKECKHCRGTGWVLQKDENQREVAVRCRCRSEERLNLRLVQSNIPERFAGYKIENYYPETGNSSQGKVKKIIEKYIHDYPAVNRGLLLQGPVGVGKTHLLCSLAFELIRRKNVGLYYVDWTALVREMRTGEDNTDRDFQAINKMLKNLEKVELLIFDEIGATAVSKYVYDNIYYLINSRYNAGKMLIGATNLPDESTFEQETLSQRIGERLRSRLYEMTTVLPIRGTDFRKNNY